MTEFQKYCILGMLFTHLLKTGNERTYSQIQWYVCVSEVVRVEETVPHESLLQVVGEYLDLNQSFQKSATILVAAVAFENHKHIPAKAHAYLHESLF